MTDVVRELREAIAGRLELLDGLQASAYELSDQTPPYADVIPTPFDYRQAMQDGLATFQFQARILTSLADDVGAQVTLDAYLEPVGPTSARAALEADPEGWPAYVVQDGVTVTRAEGYRRYTREDGTELLGCSLIVEAKLDLSAVE